MKFIHCADVHLGSRIDSKFPREVSERKREEVRNTFRRMVEYARREDVCAILLSGDVFDSDKPFKKDKEFFFSVVEGNPEIDFLYLRGNHDSEGESRDLPNLKLFGEEWRAYEYDDVVISGIEMMPGNATSLYAALSLSTEKKNIVMLHGQIGDASGVDKINLPRLRDKHIDYLALGHVHTYASGALDARGTYAYCGCPEGRGFDEAGEKGFVLIEVSEDGVTHTFQPFCERMIEWFSLDVTGYGNAYDVSRMAAEYITEKKSICRFELTGELEAEADELAADVKKYLESECFFVDVKDRTRRRIDVGAYQNDLSLAGEFVRHVFASAAYSDEEKEQIVSLGLRALKGIEVDR